MISLTKCYIITLINHARSPQSLLGEGVARPFLAVTVEKPLSAALLRRTVQCHSVLALLELSAGSLNACVTTKIICLLKIVHTTAQETTKNVSFFFPSSLRDVTLQVIITNTWRWRWAVWCWAKFSRCWRDSFDFCLPYCFRKTSNRINWDFDIFADKIIQKIVLPGFLTGVINKSLAGHATWKQDAVVERPQEFAILKQSSEQKNLQKQKRG